MGAYTPVEHALQLKFGFSNRRFKKCILTEGIRDYYFYKMFFKLDGYEIIPGAGCDNLKDMISILIGCSEQFLVILDNDEQGRGADKKYSNFFQESYIENKYLYSFKVGNLMLEDILTKEDQAKIILATDINEVKDAISKLYFNENILNDIIKGLSRETKQNITKIKKDINAHFNK